MLDHGFIGVKLSNEHVCTDPAVAPVVEAEIELRVPILHHAGRIHHPFPEQPNISHGGHLAEPAIDAISCFAIYPDCICLSKPTPL